MGRFFTMGDINLSKNWGNLNTGNPSKWEYCVVKDSLIGGIPNMHSSPPTIVFRSFLQKLKQDF